MLKYSNFVSLQYNEYTEEYYNSLNSRLPQIIEDAGLEVGTFTDIIKDLEHELTSSIEYKDRNDCPDSIKELWITFSYDKEDDVVLYESCIQVYYEDEEGDAYIKRCMEDAEKFCRLANSYGSDYGL